MKERAMPAKEDTGRIGYCSFLYRDSSALRPGDQNYSHNLRNNGEILISGKDGMTSFQRAPVGNDPEDDHRCGKDQKGDEILTDHVKTLVPEDDAPQGMDAVYSGLIIVIQRSHPGIPITG